MVTRPGASVASFFVSRVDTEADKRLEAVGRGDLQGKLAVANAKLAYQLYLETFSGDRWEFLAGKGARPQRCLWASTSTKNPAYPDMIYVTDLIGRTRQHDAAGDDPGFPGPWHRRAELPRVGLGEAEKLFADLAEAGVDYDDITETLEAEGVQKFADSFGSCSPGSRPSAARSRRAGRMTNPLGEGCGSGGGRIRAWWRSSARPAISPGGSSSPPSTPSRTGDSSGALRGRGRCALRSRRTCSSERDEGCGQAVRLTTPSARTSGTRSARNLRYIATEFDSDAGEDSVAELLDVCDEEDGTEGNRVYYLAVPPQAFETVVEEIGERRDRKGWTRVIVEKPFGHDLASAGELNTLLHKWFDESEIFRIDHYLGKETVQNMLALRFANGIFEPIWNRQFIDHVQITVAETIGVEGRAGFYEQAGAIRDIFQNHLLQLLALTAMEPPIDFTADSVRNEKVKVLRALHTPGPKNVVRGQYGAGYVEGVEVPPTGRSRGRSGLDHGDIRRGEAVRGQLALGRHAVLRACRQAARPPGDDDRDPVPASAAPAVRGDRR